MSKPVLNLKKPARLDKLTQAFAYQLEATEYVRSLPYSAIFFEQGLGKTKIAIDLTIDWLSDSTVDSVIIVTKKGLVKNWIDEFEIHSFLRPRVISSDRASNHRAFFSTSRVYIANFEAIALEEDRIIIFSHQRRLAIILDESQKIKNADSKLTKSFFRLSPCFLKKVIMTGTPMANRPFDIWSQIYFLDQGKSLGNDFKTFKSEVDLPGGSAEIFKKHLSSIYPKISSFAMRLTKEGSGIELPGKVYKTLYAPWEPIQHTIYKKIRNELRLEIISDGIPSIDNAEPLLKRLLRLTQIASNPSLVDKNYYKTPGKLSVLKNLVAEVQQNKEKAIIWTSFVDNCVYLTKALVDIGAVQLHGRMSIEDRNKSITRFKSNLDCSLLIATPAAAKEGLTLTVANHVIFYDRSFSLDDYLQAQDRIHRISQTKTCYVYNIHLPNSIDEWVNALINLKSAAARFGMGDTTEDNFLDSTIQDIKGMLGDILGEDKNNVE